MTWLSSKKWLQKNESAKWTTKTYKCIKLKSQQAQYLAVFLYVNTYSGGV